MFWKEALESRLRTPCHVEVSLGAERQSVTKRGIQGAKRKLVFLDALA
jgi:hypothetical protein